MTGTDAVDFRPLNVTLRPGSKALKAYHEAAMATDAVAAGFAPRPDLDLRNHHGRTISELAYINCYLGGRSAWPGNDRANIDRALEAAMTDDGLQEIIAQYYQGPISSRSLPSTVLDTQPNARFFKDDAEQLVAQLASDGLLDSADPANTVINLMLPEGIILVDGNSDGSQDEAPHARAILVDDDQADSTQGLGGFHGSIVSNGTTFYYAVGVYSKDNNGIDGFGVPWKNVVATFYHELNEARTDADIEDVIRTGNATRLGWYSRRGGEIGDIPMALAGADLTLVMKDVALVSGGTAPIQLMWSNRDHAPAEPEMTTAEVSGS